MLVLGVTLLVMGGDVEAAGARAVETLGFASDRAGRWRCDRDRVALQAATADPELWSPSQEAAVRLRRHRRCRARGFRAPRLVLRVPAFGAAGSLALAVPLDPPDRVVALG